MKRFPDWQLRLAMYVEERTFVPAAWGVQDCALFAAGAVEAQTGVHLCPELRDYRGVREALRKLHEVGGVRGLADKALGERIPPALARVGDVVVMESGKREALAICNGQTAIGVDRTGVVAFPMTQAVAAWRID